MGSIIVLGTIVSLVMVLANKFLIPISTEMGISRSAFSLVSSITQSLGIFLSPFVAKIMSNGKLKKYQSLSVLGFAFAYASYALARNVFHLYIIAFVVGVFYLGATIIPISIIITNWFVKKRGLALSLTMCGISLGGIFFNPIITSILNNYGWRMTYVIVAIIIVALPLPISLFVLYEKPEDLGLKPYGFDEELSGVVAKKRENNGLSITVKQSMKTPFFIMLMLAMFTNGFINTGALGQFPPAIHEMHDLEVQSIMISIYSLVGILGKILIGWINDKFGIIASTFWTSITFAFAFLFMLKAENLTMLYIVAILFGVGMTIGTVSPPLIVSDIYGSKHYGEAYGIANSTLQVGFAMGSVCIAMIYDYFNSYTYAWILLFVLTCLTFMLYLGSILYSKKYKEA